MARVSAVVRVVHDARPVSAGVFIMDPRIYREDETELTALSAVTAVITVSSVASDISVTCKTHPSHSNRLRDQ